MKRITTALQASIVQPYSIDTKNVCYVYYYFYKKMRFLTFLFLELFLFSSEKFINSTRPPKLLHKTTFK